MRPTSSEQSLPELAAHQNSQSLSSAPSREPPPVPVPTRLGSSASSPTRTDFEDATSPAWDEENYSEDSSVDGRSNDLVVQDGSKSRSDPAAGTESSTGVESTAGTQAASSAEQSDVPHLSSQQSSQAPKHGVGSTFTAPVPTTEEHVKLSRPPRAENPQEPIQEVDFVDRQQSGTISSHGEILDSHFDGGGPAPTLPPRPTPLHSNDNHARVTNTSLVPSTQPPNNTRNATQRSATYEIKKIIWHDADATSSPRLTPILVQSANGPCPLLALVNALTLSTPVDMESGLVEALRAREQISLGLLLDAVFDELISGRRRQANQELPDVDELYTFLLTLHTGMNVNPRFVPYVKQHQTPTTQNPALPGLFEETRELRLYSTFSIPLIHGWLPARSDVAFHALTRHAHTYEDAQTLMLREDELMAKLSNESMTPEEQALLQDISSIGEFLRVTATQLTLRGLEILTKNMPKGAIAIFFRNDHFSTIYKHPISGNLLQLVTDSGYASNPDVVWESLVDVNGETAEFYSGDFKPLSGNESQDESSGSPQVLRSGSNTIDSEAPRSPNHEQEDRDLALALQLQEEEEEHHRSGLATRRRASQLAQQVIEQTSTTSSLSQRTPFRGDDIRPIRSQQTYASRPIPTPSIDISRPGTIHGTNARPIVPPRRINAPPRPADPEAGIDTPPPSYEHAASLEPYEPPENHPAHANASIAQATANAASSNASSLTGSETASGTTSSSYSSIGAGQGRGRRPANPQAGVFLGPGYSTSLAGRRQYSGGHLQRDDRECSIM